jgi:hypothetical protein
LFARPERSFAGVNLPWVDYGHDFGSNAWHPSGGIAAREDSHKRLERAADRLQADDAGCLRWFLLCDGRAGIRFDENGAPLGLDDAFFRDMDAALAVLSKRDLGVMFVLFDYLLGSPKEDKGAVQLFGRARLITDPGLREQLIERVIVPIVARYGDHPAIRAWDIMNEPEWVDVDARSMKRFLERITEVIHAHARQPVTVGSANTKRLDLVRGIGLDFYQVHWYEHFGDRALAKDVKKLGLDRPVLLGEYPGRVETTRLGRIMGAAKSAGYFGALVWSLLSDDARSGYPGDFKSLSGV